MPSTRSLVGIILAVALTSLVEAGLPVAGDLMCCMGMSPSCVACRCRAHPSSAACAGVPALDTAALRPYNNSVPAADHTDNSDNSNNSDNSDNVTTATAPSPAMVRIGKPDVTGSSPGRVAGARCLPTVADLPGCPIAMCIIPAGWEETCTVVPADRVEYTVTAELACCACDLCLFELVNGTGPCPGDSRTCPAPAAPASPATVAIIPATGNATATATAGTVTETAATPPLNVTTATRARTTAVVNTTRGVIGTAPTQAASAIPPGSNIDHNNNNNNHNNSTVTSTGRTPVAPTAADVADNTHATDNVTATAPTPAAVTATATATASVSVLAVWEPCPAPDQHDIRCPVARCVAPPVGCHLAPRSRMRFAITPFDGGCCGCGTCQYEAVDGSGPCADDPVAAYNTHCPLRSNTSAAAPAPSPGPIEPVTGIPGVTSTAPSPSPTTPAPVTNRTSTAVFTTVLRGGATRPSTIMTTVLRGGMTAKPAPASSLASDAGAVIVAMIAIALSVAAAAVIGVVACTTKPPAKPSPSGRKGFVNPIHEMAGADAFGLTFGAGSTPRLEQNESYAGALSPRTAFAQVVGRQPISSSIV